MCVQEQWRPSLAKPGLDDTLSFTSLLSIPRDIARGVFERRALDLYDQANDVDREHDAEQDALVSVARRESAATCSSKFHVVIDNLKKGILVENLRKHGFDP